MEKPKIHCPACNTTHEISESNDFLLLVIDLLKDFRAVLDKAYTLVTGPMKNKCGNDKEYVWATLALEFLGPIWAGNPKFFETLIQFIMQHPYQDILSLDRERLN